MPGRRMVGWTGLVVGGILLLSGAAWGHAGYFASQAPLLLLLVIVGAAIAVGGGGQGAAILIESV